MKFHDMTWQYPVLKCKCRGPWRKQGMQRTWLKTGRRLTPGCKGAATREGTMPHFLERHRLQVLMSMKRSAGVSCLGGSRANASSWVAERRPKSPNDTSHMQKVSGCAQKLELVWILPHVNTRKAELLMATKPAGHLRFQEDILHFSACPTGAGGLPLLGSFRGVPSFILKGRLRLFCSSVFIQPRHAYTSTLSINVPLYVAWTVAAC